MMKKQQNTSTTDSVTIHDKDNSILLVQLIVKHQMKKKQLALY